MLQEITGLYAARLAHLSNPKKDVALTGPSGFNIDKGTK